MKNKPHQRLSIFAIILIVASSFAFRLYNSDLNPQKTLNVLTWDALGYYIYLPGIFIYDDLTDLDWYPEIEKTYGASGGGDFYQANQQVSGKYVFKYLGGVAILQSPFFGLAHLYAKLTDYPPDGFSKPYQYGIALGALFYGLLSLLLLRNILLRFFDDGPVAITLLLLTLATNWVQYIAVDGALSHGYIFPLYVFIIWLTIKWHNKPSLLFAAASGLIIGIATICRPTELIMFVIPLLWNTHSREASKQKWGLVNSNKSHVMIAILFGFIGILPQLIYWYHSTGDLVYNVGSKWSFLSPFFRVLFGWEKGWFIYTPVTLFFVVGFFFMKSFPFKKSVLVFCLLNLWIITSWFHWRYGASYSTRALVQSYPVFALGLGALIAHVYKKKWRPVLWLLSCWLIFVNLFQIWQYDKDILHADHMNRLYYSQIFLNHHPSALEMSLLDTDSWVKNEKKLQKKVLHENKSVLKVDEELVFPIQHIKNPKVKKQWLKITTELKLTDAPGNQQIIALLNNSTISKTAVRLNRPLYEKDSWNEYAFYMELPVDSEEATLSIKFGDYKNNDIFYRNFQIIYLH